MNRATSVRDASRWLLLSAVAAAIGACTSSSGNETASPGFDAGMPDATISSDSGEDGTSPDGASGYDLAACLIGLGNTLASGGDAGPCGALYGCVQSSCNSQLTSCFGSGYASGIATGSVCASFSSCAQGQSCSAAGGLSCFQSASPTCQCCVDTVAQCAQSACLGDFAACSAALLSAAMDAGTCADSGTTSGPDSSIDSGSMATIDSSTGADSSAAEDSSTGVDSGTVVDSGGVVDSGVAVDSGLIVDSGTAQDAGTCGLPMVTCNSVVIDPCTNTQNCGATGNCTGSNQGTNCGDVTGAVCKNGVCGCPPGQYDIGGYCQPCYSPNVVCGSTCVNPSSSAQYCGASGNCSGANAGSNCTQSPYGAGYACIGGSCTISCTGLGSVLCGGVCKVDDPLNCGSCGNVCVSGTCLPGNGKGTCDCPSPYTQCGPNCIDTFDNRDNCGGCGMACEPPTPNCKLGNCSP